MEGNNEILYNYLKSAEIVECKKLLYERLNSTLDETFVYYIMPLNNLKSVIIDGGIKCRNSLGETFTDLSGQNVQSKREGLTFGNKKLKLANASKCSIDLELHDCINFFLNPLNLTFVAFQHKTLVNKVINQNHFSAIPCLLEISLKDLLNDSSIYWGISERNLASRLFTSFSKSIFSSYKWSEIFSLNRDKSTNSYRSAEFVVFRQTNGTSAHSDIISKNYINRIIVKSSNETLVKSEIKEFSQKVIAIDNLFEDVDYLLFPEKKFVHFIVDNKSTQSLDDLADFINKFENLSKNKLFIPQLNNFFSTFMAYSYHGLGHTTRVLFWSFFISQLNKLDKEKEKVLLISAVYHDYQREKNDEDNYHGQNSVEKFDTELKKIFNNTSNYESCKNAIKYHCKEDNECPNVNRDIIWQILKDADALDRGRFSSPNTKGGCNTSYLRNSEVKKLSSYLSGLSYQLAVITRYTAWNENPLSDLKNQIIISIRTALAHGILSGYYSNEIQRLLEKLRT